MSNEEIQPKVGDHGDESPPMPLAGKLAGLSLSKQVLALALWPFLQNLMGVGVGFSDMILAGRMETGASGEAIMDMMGAGMHGR